MQKIIIVFFLLFSVTAAAQGTTSSTLKKLRPLRPLKMKTDTFRFGVAYNNFSFASVYSEKVNLAKSILFSYSHLRPKDYGFLLRGNYSDYVYENFVLGSLFRLETNLTYAFNTYMYVFGGINVGLYSGKIKEQIQTSELGMQLGIGADMYKGVGLELSYIENAGRVDKDPDAKGTSISGYELALVVGF